ncbi:T7SS effector LXG polymorphic toxin [Psychrobacillus sp. FSL W7-1493]|uniref:T7SS effector LXG polymorphic toxin n=1 Tax=Psychrobacillus sp. FSL W7-1493 TaxID=2921552 RepID=UPI0030FD141E
MGQLTASLTDETNSIMDQVSDIVALPHLDDSAVQEGVISSKRKRDDTLSQLYEFDATQTTALNTMEQDIRTMETWLSDIEGIFKSGLMDVHFQADNWGALTAKNKLKTELASRTSPIAVLSSIVNRENQLTTMLQAFIAGNGPIRFGYGGLIHINNPFVGTDMLVLSCARPENVGIEQEKMNIQKNSNIFQDFYDLGIGALKSVATINPFDEKSFGEAMLERANDEGQRQTDDFVEVQRFTHRTSNTSLLGLPSELHKAGTGDEHLFYTTREFGEGGGTDLVADMLGYGVPGLGAAKAIRGTSLGAKGLTTGISARNLGQFAKEGASIGGIMSIGEIGGRELLNPEDTNWKQNALDLGLNIGAGATLDPLLSMAVPIAKSVKKMVSDGSIVEAGNTPLKNGEGMPKDTVLLKHPILDSPRVGSALKDDFYHNFNDIIDNYAKDAQRFDLPNKKGHMDSLYQIEGSVVKYESKYVKVKNNAPELLQTKETKDGVFEWVVDPTANTVTHRTFIPGGKVTGKINQWGK